MLPLFFQVVRMTATPAMGAVTSMRSALVSACFIAFSARSRLNVEDLMSAPPPARLRS